MPYLSTQRRHGPFRFAWPIALASACSTSGLQELGTVVVLSNEAGSVTGAGGSLIGGDSSAGGTMSTAGADADCVTPATKDVNPAEATLYLVVDRSRLMQNDPQQQNGTWTDLINGLDNYLDSNNAATLNFGMAFYPFPCQARIPNRDCNMGNQICDVVANSEPFPDIGPARNAQNALGMVPSAGNFPPIIRPALEGALRHVRSYEQSHKDRFIIPVLIAGGPPDTTTCSPDDIMAVQNVARSSSTKIFVIAFESNSTPLDPIADAGGSGRAFEIDGRQNGSSIAAQFNTTFQTILDDAHKPCVFEADLPPSVPLADVMLQVNPLNPADSVQPWTRVSSRQDCTAAATTTDKPPLQWYYDVPVGGDAAPTTPAHFIACDYACQTYRALPQTGGVLKIIAGCETTRIP